MGDIWGEVWFDVVCSTRDVWECVKFVEGIQFGVGVGVSQVLVRCSCMSRVGFGDTWIHFEVVCCMCMGGDEGQGHWEG